MNIHDFRFCVKQIVYGFYLYIEDKINQIEKMFV